MKIIKIKQKKIPKRRLSRFGFGINHQNQWKITIQSISIFNSTKIIIPIWDFQNDFLHQILNQLHCICIRLINSWFSSFLHFTLWNLNFHRVFQNLKNIIFTLMSAVYSSFNRFTQRSLSLGPALVVNNGIFWTVSFVFVSIFFCRKFT